MKKTLLIANRGEIAVRLAATARDQGYAVVTVYPEDDATCAHVREGDASVLLPGIGAAAYLDAEAVIQAAVETGATALHPGYGFLSENADFADQVQAAGLKLIGPPGQAMRDMVGSPRAKPAKKDQDDDKDVQQDLYSLFYMGLDCQQFEADLKDKFKRYKGDNPCQGKAAGYRCAGVEPDVVY